MPKIDTFDSDGKPNGWVLPVWSELSEPGLRPAQVYVTAISPRTRKGPHLHKERRGVFHCIAGRVLVRKNYQGDVLDKIIEPGGEYCFVPCGTPAALYNIGDGEALVLNMPNPSWSQENSDEWPVTHWQDPADWKVQS